MSRYNVDLKSGGHAAIGYDNPLTTYFWFEYPAPNEFGAVMCGCLRREVGETLEAYSARLLLEDEATETWPCEHQPGENAPTVMEGVFPSSMTNVQLLTHIRRQCTPEAIEMLAVRGHMDKISGDLPF